MSNSLEDLDPHNYFGTVVPPNCETTPMGVTGTFKVGLGVHRVLNFIILYINIILLSVFKKRVGVCG